MFTLFILLILIVSFYTGRKRGLLLQILYTVGYLVSFLIARTYYKELANKLELYIPYPSITPNTQLVFYNQKMSFGLDKAFYAAVAFLILFFLGRLVLRFLAVFLHAFTSLPVLHGLNGLLGGLVNCVVVYLILCLVLTTLSFLPINFIQHLFENSGLARIMVEQTPIFSKQIFHLWM
ncbi:CvpA family protein [Melissococcus plutonius]|uniref:Colicin V production protein n=2 Tax=Melissococcus plutonius TaxID=33970 RepID=F3YAB7_MELPT|nr:CvpA family protein [Melissococcus plutonius]BAL62191.1 colicin V production protein [Melissococcus plutonius DAT561]AIM24927.1 colicin V production family protein [Melissococcus plutonius S1]KMT25070.1 colicin V production family protein [Melissococcus plutonius]KMT26707.1 colicin V production family protein [Melissococcus plutonius]KMT27957.1 colicin V production family protein [Melissococcus plutonius]